MGNRPILTLSACVLALLSIAVHGQDESGSAKYGEAQSPEAESKDSSAQPDDGFLDGLSKTDPPPDSTKNDKEEVETIPVAAEKDKPEPVARSRRGTIEEIVVTAQKREEDLQDVPIAVQAFSGDELVKMGITDTQALQNITPGLVYNSNAGYAQAYVRGIGSDATLPTADPSVATYVDGVYYPFIQSTIQSFGDVQRIEVLKGPQGTLYGRNSTGGAINVVTKDPGQETDYSADLEGGNFGKKRAALFGSVPLTSWLAVSASGFYDYMDALYHQTNPTGPPIVDTKNWGLRVKTLLSIGDSFNLNLSGYALDHEGADTAVANAFKEYSISRSFGAEPTPTPYAANADLPEHNLVNIKGANLKATYEGLSWFDIKSISAYQKVYNLGFVDFERSPKAVAGFGASPAFAKTFSEEVQITSKDSDRFQWVAGGFYLDGTGGYVPLRFYIAQPNPFLPPPPGPVPPGSYSVIPLAAQIDTHAYAAFGQLTWTALDWLKLTGGLRYSTETRDFVRNQIYPTYIDSHPSNAYGEYSLEGQSPTTENPPRSATFKSITPKYGIEVPFQNLWIADSGMLYLSYAKGFKSGTFNPVRLVDTTPPPPVQPESVKAYEGGFKTDLFGNKVRLNASAFMYDYANLQLQFIELTGGGAVRLENAGKAKIKGAEMEFDWVLLDGLTLSLNAAQMLKAVYTECNCTGYDQDTGQSSHQDFAGHTMQRAPKTTATGQLSYVFDLLGGELEAALNAYYNSGFWFDVQNVFFQPAYALYGARLGYISKRWSNLTLSIFGSNLTDQTYLINGNVNDFSEFGTFGTPRTYGLRLKWAAG